MEWWNGGILEEWVARSAVARCLLCGFVSHPLCWRRRDHGDDPVPCLIFFPLSARDSRLDACPYGHTTNEVFHSSGFRPILPSFQYSGFKGSGFLGFRGRSHHSNIPLFHYSSPYPILPSFHHSIIPIFHYSSPYPILPLFQGFPPGLMGVGESSARIVPLRGPHSGR